MRICTDCGQSKPTSEFTPIRGTPRYYGRCKACRARRAWEQAHPGRQYVKRDRTPAERTCTDCGKHKPIAEFVRIKACKAGWYGRCRACRARRARERYRANPQEREVQKARVRRNRQRRRMGA